MPNELSLMFRWSALIGGDPKHGHNELHLLRQIARARGNATTHTMNEVAALRAIAASYGKSNVGYMNELDALRAIVDGMGAKPSNRNLHDMNEIDCLWAIIRAGGGGAAAAFTPTSITGLKLWLKADALSLADNDAVASWTDSSGLGNHAVQATEAAKPTYKTAIQNGKPVLRFDGTDDFLACPAITAASGLSAFVVSKVTLATSFGMTLVLKMFDIELRQNGVSGNMQLLVNNATPVIAGGAGTAWHVHSFTNNGSNLTELWTDGTSNGTQANSTACGTPTIGARPAAANPLNGDIAEVLLYDSSLSAGNRQSVEAYLKAKYATP